MRYLVAIVLGGAAALAATLTISSAAAVWVVGQFTFESPDEVSNLHDAVFMGVNLLALLVGWTIGWAIGSAMERSDEPA